MFQSSDVISMFFSVQLLLYCENHTKIASITLLYHLNTCLLLYKNIPLKQRELVGIWLNCKLYGKLYIAYFVEC